MQRFYIENLKISGENFLMKERNIVYQLVKVLRARIGMKIILFDGINSIDYLCEIIDFSKKEIELKLLKKIEKESELDFKLNLFQAFPNKLDKIEYIIQKGVEVGFTSFTFYRSERSQKVNITEKKQERLNKILVEAVEQSGRNKIPTLTLCLSPLIKGIVGEFFVSGENSIFLHTKKNNSLSLKKYINYKKEQSAKALCGQAEINIFIGPEGGFSDEEVLNFEERKFTKIHLGNRILRTETAGVVVGFTLGQML